MAITVTKLSNNPRFCAEGNTEIEFSITFDTNYPTTGGESLGFGTNTNFVSVVRYAKVSKPFRNTNYMFFPELARGTNDGATNAKLKLFRIQSQATNVNAKVVECSNTTDCSAVSGRLIVGGY